MSKTKRLVSITQAAAYAGVCNKTIRRRITAGELLAYRLGSARTIRVDLDDVDRLLRPIPTAGGAA